MCGLQATCRLVEECGFDRVNTAAYSPRPNTPAALEAEQVGISAHLLRLLLLHIPPVQPQIHIRSEIWDGA